MKIVLILALACVFVGVAVAQIQCGIGALPKCKGPVQAFYENNDCSKDPVAYVQLLRTETSEGGKCFSLGPNKYDRSVKSSCGTSFNSKSWFTNDCDGPYSYSSAPIDKCFKIESSPTLSFKYKCASASTAAFSAALIALLALFAHLF